MDEILITGNDNQIILNVIESLDKTFALKDLGNIGNLLGIQVETTNGDFYLSQKEFITDIYSTKSQNVVC